MRQTIGRDSSSSPRSSWDADEENHSGPHFILTVFPGGQMVLTTPDELDEKLFIQIQNLFSAWLAADSSFPLVIGNCVVQFAATSPKSVEVHRG